MWSPQMEAIGHEVDAARALYRMVFNGALGRLEKLALDPNHLVPNRAPVFQADADVIPMDSRVDVSAARNNSELREKSRSADQEHAEIIAR